MKFMYFLKNDVKYLIGYVAPIAALLGLNYGGWGSPGAIYVAFVFIPLLELFGKGSSANFSEEEEQERAKSRFFDGLLYLHLPILYGLLFFFGHQVLFGNFHLWEQVGMVLNMGLIIGVSGINVGHELGHRKGIVDRWVAWLLLIPALYMHFYIEHNRGHHRWVATERDPASARRSEGIYTFWWRSITQGWRNAWYLESERLQKVGKVGFHPQNQMLVFQLIQLSYLSIWYFMAGWSGVIAAISIALVGVLLLESINYIEHYGLRRKVLPSGKYEKVSPQHSWNSNHHLGRIFLFELTRHADHHYKASRKYQVLRHYEESPHLPLGYPGSIQLALVPPLWFNVMNRTVDQWNATPSGITSNQKSPQTLDLEPETLNLEPET